MLLSIRIKKQRIYHKPNCGEQPIYQKQKRDSPETIPFLKSSTIGMLTGCHLPTIQALYIHTDHYQMPLEY